MHKPRANIIALINHRLVPWSIPMNIEITNPAVNRPPVINRRGPMRAYSRPANCDEMRTPNAWGNVVRPLVSELCPLSN